VTLEKIPSLLERDFTGDDPKHSPVTGRVNPAAAWVLTDDGVIARRKWDGTCVLVTEDLRVLTRRTVRPGATPPPGFVPAETDERTGKTFGWEPYVQSPFADVILFNVVAWGDHGIGWGPSGERLLPGTYELIGPKVQGNAERLVGSHRLERHDTAPEFSGVRHPQLNDDGNLVRACNTVLFLGEEHGWEGLVFYHPDGRRAKLKARDVAELRALQESAR
jgi:hypothetical protein